MVRNPLSDYNELGTPINVLSYDSSGHKYTFPSDGYINIISSYANPGSTAIVICGANGSSSFVIRANSSSSASDANGIFVKKDMQSYIAEKNAGSSAYYYPFN